MSSPKSFFEKCIQFRHKLPSEPALTFFLNQPNSEPDSQLYKEVQNQLRELQEQVQPIPVSGSFPASLSAPSNSTNTSSSTGAPIPLIPASLNAPLSCGATQSPFPSNAVANRPHRPPDPSGNSSGNSRAATAGSESNPLPPNQPVPDDALPDVDSQERDDADADAEFQALAALPLSQLLANAESLPMHIHADDSQDSQQEPSSLERADAELRAIAALPLSKLLADAENPMHNRRSATRFGPNPLACRVLDSQDSADAGAMAQENRNPNSSQARDATDDMDESPVGRSGALPAAKRKKPANARLRNGPAAAASSAPVALTGTASSNPVVSRLRTRPVSASASTSLASPSSSPRRSLQASSNPAGEQKQTARTRGVQQTRPAVASRSGKALRSKDQTWSIVLSSDSSSESESESESESVQEADARETQRSSGSSRYDTAGESSSFSSPQAEPKLPGVSAAAVRTRIPATRTRTRSKPAPAPTPASAPLGSPKRKRSSSIAKIGMSSGLE